MKFCTKCKKIKSLTLFTKNKNHIDGLSYDCIDCRRAANAEWRMKNREKIRIAGSMWRASNPEKVKAANAAWYANNKDKSKRANTEWRTINSNRHKATKAVWAKKNAHLRVISEQNRRAKKYASGGKISSGLAQKLFKLQHGKCACCNQPLGNNYHLDHIMPLALGGANEDYNMQLLRAICNIQKHAKHPIDYMQSKGFLL